MRVSRLVSSEKRAAKFAVKMVDILRKVLNLILKSTFVVGLIKNFIGNSHAGNDFGR